MRYILHGAPTDNQLAAISDALNSADSQTCTYAYDDLARLDNDNCGSTWSQSFSDDAFGNLSKSGSISFAPTYNLLNQVSVVGGYNPTYDADGNMTSDTVNTYNWDSDGNMIKAVTLTATTQVTYDAMDRAVEFEVGSAYTQIVYGPGGGKLALMNGQSLTKAFVPLAGGAVAVYNASGLQYHRHGDWLGSSRLASTPSRGVYYDGAYAPYGENYAESGTKDRSFTGQDQDMVSSGSYPLYDFLMREYHPTWGRWISPDPAGLAAVNPANPQTWNRYAYVGNNPVNSTDPLGLTHGNDCVGGPCTSFSATLSNGCTVNVTFFEETVTYEGQPYVYDMPVVSVDCSGSGSAMGQGAGNNPGGGGGGGTAPGIQHGLPPGKDPCPGSISGGLARVAVFGIVGPPAGAAQAIAKVTGHVVTVGIDANATIKFGTFGWSFHGGGAVAFDPQGNIALLGTGGAGGGFGGDVGVTGQFGYLQSASVLDLGAGSTLTYGGVYGQELQVGAGSDLEGNFVLSVGAGEGVSTSSTVDVTSVNVIACGPE